MTRFSSKRNSAKGFGQGSPKTNFKDEYPEKLRFKTRKNSSVINCEARGSPSLAGSPLPIQASEIKHADCFCKPKSKIQSKFPIFQMMKKGKLSPRRQNTKEKKIFGDVNFATIGESNNKRNVIFDNFFSTQDSHKHQRNQFTGSPEKKMPPKKSVHGNQLSNPIIIKTGIEKNTRLRILSANAEGNFFSLSDTKVTPFIPKLI